MGWASLGLRAPLRPMPGAAFARSRGAASRPGRAGWVALTCRPFLCSTTRPCRARAAGLAGLWVRSRPCRSRLALAFGAWRSSAINWLAAAVHWRSSTLRARRRARQARETAYRSVEPRRAWANPANGEALASRAGRRSAVDPQGDRSGSGPRRDQGLEKRPRSGRGRSASCRAHATGLRALGRFSSPLNPSRRAFSRSSLVAARKAATRPG
jgi:hypothetical protein